MGKIKNEDLEPELGPFRYYLEIFFELNTTRNESEGEQISILSVRDYAAIFDLDFFELWDIVRVVDSSFLIKMNKMKEKKNEG